MSQGKGETFSQSVMTAIADALGDTDEGLSGMEILHRLETCKIKVRIPLIVNAVSTRS